MFFKNKKMEEVTKVFVNLVLGIEDFGWSLIFASDVYPTLSNCFSDKDIQDAISALVKTGYISLLHTERVYSDGSKDEPDSDQIIFLHDKFAELIDNEKETKRFFELFLTSEIADKMYENGMRGYIEKYLSRIESKRLIVEKAVTTRGFTTPLDGCVFLSVQNELFVRNMIDAAMKNQLFKFHSMNDDLENLFLENFVQCVRRDDELYLVPTTQLLEYCLSFYAWYNSKKSVCTNYNLYYACGISDKPDFSVTDKMKYTSQKKDTESYKYFKYYLDYCKKLNIKITGSNNNAFVIAYALMYDAIALYGDECKPLTCYEDFEALMDEISNSTSDNSVQTDGGDIPLLTQECDQGYESNNTNMGADDFSFIFNRDNDNDDKKANINADLASANEFLKKQTPKTIVEYLDKTIAGQEKAKKECAIFLFKQVLKFTNHDTDAGKNSLLVAGPTGCGKTEIWRKLKAISPVPIIISDVSSVTSSGWQGKNIEECFMELSEANVDRKTKDYAIIVLDEFDKICSSNTTSNGENLNRNLQGQLLSVVEGTKLRAKRTVYDTTNMGFVFLGAFEDISKKKQDKKGTKHTIGFTVHTDNQTDTKSTIFDDSSITMDDIIEYGLRSELAGRIGNMVAIDELKEDDMIKIMRILPESIVKRETVRCEKMNHKVTVTNEAADSIVKCAAKRKLGARSLKTILSRIIDDEMFDNYLSDNIVITDDVVKKYLGETVV